jgi:hypothetical protein
VPLEEPAKTKKGVTHERWLRVLKNEAFSWIHEDAPRASSPVIPKKHWPRIKSRDKRTITLVIERLTEKLATLIAEDIDWQNRTIA